MKISKRMFSTGETDPTNLSVQLLGLDMREITVRIMQQQQGFALRKVVGHPNLKAHEIQASI